MSTSASPATEIRVLEKKLAEAKKRAAPKTLAERLREANSKIARAEGEMNRLRDIVLRAEREQAAFAEEVAMRRKINLPMPQPQKKISVWSAEDVKLGRQAASVQMTVAEYLADSRAKLTQSQSDREAAARELTALKAELAANGTYTRAKSALSDLQEQFIAAAEAGDALTSEAVRKSLSDLAAREHALVNQLRSELRAAGLPEVRTRIQLWDFIPSDELRRSIDSFLATRTAALERLKKH